MPSESAKEPLAPHAIYIRASLAELLGRYSHLRAFVNKCSKEARGRSPNLFAAYSSEITEAEEELVLFAPSIFAASEAMPTNGYDLFGPFNFLLAHSSRFQKTHQALRAFAKHYARSLRHGLIRKYSSS
jgi:hypothetical protein